VEEDQDQVVAPAAQVHTDKEILEEPAEAQPLAQVVAVVALAQ
jgi:hypothetical protein